MKTSDGAELAVVGEGDGRAAAIKDRRVRLGLSQIKAAKESGRLLDGRHKISRDLIMDAEKGDASDAGYLRIDAFYDAYEEEIGLDDDLEPGGGQTVTVKISGNFGVSAVVQGPVGDLDELQALATALIREMRSEAPPE